MYISPSKKIIFFVALLIAHTPLSLSMQQQKSAHTGLISTKQACLIIGGLTAVWATAYGCASYWLYNQSKKESKKVPAYFEDLSYSQLNFYAMMGDAAYIKHAIDNKVDVNQIEKGQPSILWYAASKNHGEVAQLLLQAKADPNLTADAELFPLQSAANGGSLDMVKILVQAKADVEKKDKDGNNALLCAARSYSFSAEQRFLISIKTMWAGVGAVDQENCYQNAKYLLDHAGADASCLISNKERAEATKKFRERYSAEKCFRVIGGVFKKSSYIRKFKKLSSVSVA